MARVSGPLFSMSASGTIGKALTFGAWKGIAWVRSWFQPSNPNTALQYNVRKAITLTVAYFKTMTQETKDAWNVFAEGTGMSGYNQFCKRAMEQYIIQLDSDTEPLSVTVSGNPGSEAWVWSPVI